MDDILIDENTNEILFKDGDFAWGDSTKQNQKALLIANKGDYKQDPLVGVGIMTMLDDEGANDLLRAIRIELVKDGMTVNDLAVLPTGEIGINAEYK